MFHPTRGGNRGGQDQFDWEDVKSDKHRESYLGHSVKAPVGRWQKGKDLHWYTRSGKVDSQMSKQQEKDAIKKMEAEALAIALGKGDSKKVGSGVTKQELAEVCRKGQVERDSMDIERVEGMGFGSTRARLMYGLQSEPVKETLGATGSQQERGADPVTKSFQKTREDGSCTEDGQSRDKTKKKKDKKEKKSKKEKKHKKKRHTDDNSSPKGSKSNKRSHDHDEIDKNSKHERKRRHDHDEIDKNSKHERKRRHDHDEIDKNSKHDRKRTHDRDEIDKNSKRKRHDSSSESESSDEKQKHSRRRHDSSDLDTSRTSSTKHRVDERPRQRRQRHDTE